MSAPTGDLGGIRVRTEPDYDYLESVALREYLGDDAPRETVHATALEAAYAAACAREEAAYIAVCRARPGHGEADRQALAMARADVADIARRLRRTRAEGGSL